MNRVVGLMTAHEQEQLEGLAALGLDEREQSVLALLLDLQLNPASIDANIFPMLSLAVDLKAAIRSSGLKGVHAMCLQKLSAKNLGKTGEEAESIRVETTQKVIAEKLSVKETRKLVSKVMSSLAASSSTPPPPGVKQVLKVTGNLQKLSGEMLAKAEASKLRELQELLRQKLAEVEEVLKHK
jgi:ParB family chromosome partitioning protein